MTDATLRFARKLIEQELVLSVGCTEPAALAYASSVAASILEEPVQRLHVTTDTGTFKNALAVGLPGTSLKGPAVAVAAGALVAKPDARLKVFQSITPGIWNAAERLAERVRVNTDTMVRKVYIRVTAIGEHNQAEAMISGRHDQLVKACLNGKTLPFHELYNEDEHVGGEEIRQRLDGPANIMKCVEVLDNDELRLFHQAWRINHDFARESLGENWGLGFGKALLYGDNAGGDLLANVVKGWVAAGIEARMAGVPVPVMASGGSGNSGFTVTLGPWAAAEALGIKDQARIMRAIAIAHFFNIALKARIGRVGPLCGGALSSAIGTGCAISWLLGGGIEEMDQVVRYMVNTLTGTVCDGAKPACALKIANALACAVDAARLAQSGVLRMGKEGLGGESAEEAFDRLTRLARTAYTNTDISLTTILTDGRTVESLTV